MSSGNKNPEKKEIEVQGVLIPCGWDHLGNPTGLQLQTFNEDEYYLKMDSNGVDLLKYLNNTVKIQGHWFFDDFGNVWLQVKKFIPFKLNKAN